MRGNLRVSVPRDQTCLLFSLQIFRYLNVRDLLNCAEVCYEWKSIVQSGELWSQVCTGPNVAYTVVVMAPVAPENCISYICPLPPQINFSVEKQCLSDDTVRQVLQNYGMIVIHLNLRGCTSLNSPSFQSVCKCHTLYFQDEGFVRMIKTLHCRDHKDKFL